VFLVVTGFASAQGCTDSWLGGPGTWDTPGNWSTGKVPKIGDSVCITAASTKPYDVVVGNEAIDVASLTVGGPSNPTLEMGNSGGGTLSFVVTDAVDVDSTGTIEFGYESSFTAGSLINAGTFEALDSGNSSIALGDVTNTGTFAVQDSATLSLSAGSTFDNAGGTISNSAGTFAISTPSSGTATVELDSGGVVDNTGAMTVADTVQVDGGSICGNALEIGSGDDGTGGTLAFAEAAGTGPACGAGMATDQIRVLNVTATLSGTIPASYAVEAGDNGSGFFSLALSGDVINDGTLEPGAEGDAGTVSAAGSSDYLTNNATLTLPSGGALNASLINNGTLDVEGLETSSLQSGWRWENTSAGTITVGSGSALEVTSPTSQPATLELDSGGMISNAGLFSVVASVEVNGGSICGNALEIGTGNGQEAGTLEFPNTPGTGPACGVGMASDQITIQNNSVTLSGTIPASYTVAAGDTGGNNFDVALQGDVINDGTFEPGVDGDGGTVSAATSTDYLTNNGTLTVAGSAFNAALVNNSALTIAADETASLQNGWSWDNTSSGTITVGAADLVITSPSGQSADFIQDGVLDNAGTVNVADPIVVDGGTICGDPVNLGDGDESTGTFTLTFAADLVAGPACASGQATGQLFIYNVDATIESNIPAGYTVAMGNSGSGFSTVSTPGNLTNAGTLEPEWDATLTVDGGSGTLTNTGTIYVPPSGYVGYVDAGAVDNTSGNVEVPYDGYLSLSGSYDQGTAGTFTPQLDGTSEASTYGVLVATGEATVAGTLDIDTISGFSPTGGNTFKVITGASVAGTFGTILGQYPPGNNTAYRVTYDPSDVTLGVSGESTTSLTVSESGGGSGTVSSSPAGILCGSTCVAGFPQNQKVTLTEAPASGSQFSGWSGDCSGTSTTCQVTLSTAQSVTASFGPTTTTTALQSSAEPSVVAQQVTYTATVSPAPNGGTVAFTDAGSTISGCGSVDVNTSTGVAKCSPTYAVAGSHTIQASYSGDSSFARSQSEARIQIVDGANTSSSLQSSANPSTPGEQVIYTATVSPVPDGGTVAFTDGGSTISGCGSVAVNTTTGMARCDATYASLGAHTIEAAYAGGSDYGGSTTGPLDQVVRPTATSTSLGSSANPSTPGEQVTYSATVSPVPDGGSVGFADGGTTISGCGSVAVSTTTGKATCQVTYANAGPHSIVATYSGDTNFAGSPSTTLNQVVSQTDTTTGLQSSANPSTAGEQVTYTATVSPVPDGGTVAFADNGTTIGNCGAVTVNTTSGKATCQVTYATGGTHPIKATYSGDTNYAASPSTTLTQVVGGTSTRTLLGSSANPSTVGNQVTYTATVSPVPDGGTVAFTDGGRGISACGSVAVNTTTGKATCQVTYPTAGLQSIGPHSIQATYSGDTDFAGSPSTTLNQVVDTIPTTTAIGSSVNPSAPGQQVTYTATVSPVPDGGTVTFTDGGVGISGPCDLATVNTSTGKATCQVTYATAGPHSIQATYSGDTNYAGSPSTALNQQVVSHSVTPTHTSVQSSANPSATGASVTYTATVSPTPDGGTVAFTDGGLGISGCGTVAVNTSTGQATCQATYTTAGSHSIQATYSGDADFGSSPSNALTQVVAAPHLVSLQASVNPATPGQEVTYTATVSPAPGPGTTISIGYQGVTVPVFESVCGDLPVNPTTGTASCTFPASLSDASGSPPTILVLALSGSPYGQGLPTGDADLTESINQGAATSTSLQSSANPSATGASVTYTATVSPVPDGGTVAFTDGGVGISGCGSVAVNTSTGSASCQATYTTASSHPIQATYSGDTNFAGSASTTLKQVVSPSAAGGVPTAIDLQAYPNPASPGQNVVFTASVLPDAVVIDGIDIQIGWVRNTPGCDMFVGICQLCVTQGFCELAGGDWPMGGVAADSDPIYFSSSGSFTFEATYTDTGSPQPPHTVHFLPSTSAPYIETVGTSTTTVQPGQTTVTAGPCSYNCILTVSGPASVPTPNANVGGNTSLGGAADIARAAKLSARRSTASAGLKIVPGAPLSQPAARKIATTLQTRQAHLAASLPSTVAKALPATCARIPSATAGSGTKTFLGPEISQVLASIYATHPTKTDAEAFSEELALAHDTDAGLACRFARVALVDAFQLGRATIAYQLGDKRLNQLDLAKVTLGALQAPGKKGALLTITPSTLGARILRLLEIAGLSHKVTITLTQTEKVHGHALRSTHRIRVL